MVRMSFVAGFAFSGSLCLILSACGGESTAYSNADAQKYAFDVMADMTANATMLPSPGQTLAELLPNQVYDVRGDGEQPKSLTAVAVIGDITSVEAGFGYWVPGDDAPSGTQIAFDDKRAEWRTVTASVSVDEWLGAVEGQVVGDEPTNTAVTSEVDVRFYIDANTDVDQFRQGLLSVDEAALFLMVAPDAPNEAGDYAVSRGQLLAPIVDGQLTLPAVPAADRGELLEDGSSVAALIDASDQPTDVTIVDSQSAAAAILAS